MDRELIVQAIENTYAKNDLRFQVIWYKARLHIYINRAADNILDYSTLINIIETAVTNLRIYDLEGFWLYSRIIGEVKPDWQRYIELDIFPTTIGEPRIALETSEHIEAMPSDSLGIEVESLTNETDDEAENSLVTAFVEEAQSDDWTESDDSQSNSVVESSFSVELNDSQNFFPEDTMKSLGLASYCFIYNKSLLEGELLPPTLEIAKIVYFFHNLPTVSQHQVLPVIDDYFGQAKIPNVHKFSVGIQQWLEQITTLPADEVRKASIWLSRYCLNPEATMVEVKNVLDTEAVRIHAANLPANLKEQTSTNDTIEELNKGDRQLIARASLKKIKALLHSKIALPLIWTTATIFVIFLGINYANSSVRSSTRIPAVCQNAIGSANYCRLAVNLIGENTFKRILQTSKSTPPFTPELEQLATYRCQRYANLKAGIALKQAEPQITPVLSSSSARIFNQIFVVEAQQKSQGQKKQDLVRVGCVYFSKSKNSKAILPIVDIIPNNWPAESYRRSVTKEPKIAFGFYQLFMLLGINTLLSGIAILSASWFSWGIKVYSLSGIYLTAIALGVVQSLASYLSIFNLVASIILQCLTLVAANTWIKSFKIQWQAGITALAMGASTIIVVTSVFYWLLIEFIYLFVN